MPAPPVVSSPDDIYSMARDAGYLPGDDPNIEDLVSGGEGHYSPGDEDNPGLPRSGASPSYLTPPSVASPSAIAAPGSPHGSSFSNSSSSKVSASNSGFSGDKFKQVGVVGDPALQRGLDEATATANGMAQRQIDPAQAAHDSGVEAAKAGVDATVKYKLAEGHNANLLEHLNNDFAAEEAKINQHYQALSNQSKADYMASLSDLRASRVDPSQLWHNMGKGDQFGMLTAAFVQDFLGVKGIHVSAMDTFNKAIDRNIDSQIQAIKTKGEVADGFKSLWYMQRSQAASDQEARARVKGFLLDGAKQAATSYMSQFEAGLATAQGQAAIAKIDDEFSKNLIDIYRHIDTNTVALRGQAVTAWGDKIKAANESWANAIAAKNAETNRLALKAQEPSLATDVVYNPESHMGQWVFQPGLDKEVKKDLINKMTQATDINGDFRRLQEIARKAGTVPDGIGGTRFAGTAQQQFDTLAAGMANKMARATDGRVSKEEVQQFLKGVRPDSWLNRAEVDKVIAEANRTMLGPIYAEVHTKTFDLPEGDPRRLLKAASSDVFPASSTEIKNIQEPPKVSIAEQNRNTDLETLQGPESQELIPKGEITEEIRKEHERMAKDRPDLFTETPILKDNGNRDYAAEYNRGSRDPKWFEATLVHLRDAAAKGDAKARDNLLEVARPFTSGVDHDNPQAVYATMMLNDLGSVPQEPSGSSVANETAPPLRDKKNK